MSTTPAPVTAIPVDLLGGISYTLPTPASIGITVDPATPRALAFWERGWDRILASKANAVVWAAVAEALKGQHGLPVDLTGAELSGLFNAHLKGTTGDARKAKAGTLSWFPLASEQAAKVAAAMDVSALLDPTVSKPRGPSAEELASAELLADEARYANFAALCAANAITVTATPASIRAALTAVTLKVSTGALVIPSTVASKKPAAK